MPEYNLSPIFIIYYDMGLGGIQKKIVDITQWMKREKPDIAVYILLRYHKGDFDISWQIKNPNVKIIYYNEWLKIKIPFFFNIFILYKTWQLKPRAILSFLTPYSFSAILAKFIFFWRKIGLVISEDCFSSGVIPLLSNSRLYSWGIKRFYPLADTIISQTSTAKNDLVESYGLPKEKIKIVRNWTSLASKNIQQADKIYDLIYVGRLAKTKNLDLLLEGLVKILKHRKQTTLYFVGDGEERHRLIDLVKKGGVENNVKFLGAKYNVAHYIKRAKIFIYSSQFRAETNPIAILEAMALGVPVLSRRFAGLTEIIHDGENGFIFDTVDEFIKKALWLLSTPREVQVVIQQAKRDVQKYYSTANINDYLAALGI